MDPELEAELEALRGTDEQRRKFDEEQRAGLRRLDQFVQEMRRHGISPFPLMTLRAAEVPRAGGLFRRSGPSKPMRYEMVDYGWPIGFENDESGPDGQRGQPAITERGVLYDFIWCEFDQERPRRMPEEVSPSGLVQLPAKYGPSPQTWYLSASSVWPPGNAGSYGSAQYVAKLLHYYIDKRNQYGGPQW